MGWKRTIATLAAAVPLLANMPGCKRDNTNDSSTGSQGRTGQVQRVPAQSKEEMLRTTVLSYLAQPRFSNSDFLEQITGVRAKLELFDLDENTVYFSIPTSSYDEAVLDRLSKRPKAISFGKTKDGKFEGERLELGDYVLHKPRHHFLRFPSDDFKVDPSSQIAIRYPSGTYTLSMQELQDFIKNKSVYGGYINAETGRDSYSVHMIANHGAFVAKKKEPSLDRLVNALVPKGTSNEGAAQKLLDFVSGEATYLESDAKNTTEVLKRPNEVLMTKGSDCTGKVILYASLLEQTGIDYRLIYTDGHITVAVEGDFRNANGMSFKIGEKQFSIAETTADWFRIGSSTLDTPITLQEIKYFQRPGKDSKIYNAKTGKELPFF